MQVFTSGEVARKLGIPYYVLNYLERTGKFDVAKRTGTGKRYYFCGDIEIV